MYLVEDIFEIKAVVVIAGGFSGHVGGTAEGYEHHFRGSSFGVRNDKREMILEICGPIRLTVTIHSFRKWKDI